MGKPQHISILPTLLISCLGPATHSQPQPRRAGQPAPRLSLSDFSHIPETNIEESKQRDAEEEISSDAQTTNLAVHL